MFALSRMHCKRHFLAGTALDFRLLSESRGLADGLDRKTRVDGFAIDTFLRQAEAEADGEIGVGSGGYGKTCHGIGNRFLCLRARDTDVAYCKIVSGRIRKITDRYVVCAG